MAKGLSTITVTPIAYYHLFRRSMETGRPITPRTWAALESWAKKKIKRLIKPSMGLIYRLPECTLDRDAARREHIINVIIEYAAIPGRPGEVWEINEVAE